MHRVNKKRGKSSRSQPVSCHFCRSRKLKCSRQSPCSNCTSRGVTCQLYPTPSLPLASNLNQSEALSSNVNADVFARLRRLEDIVIGTGPASAPSGESGNHALPRNREIPNHISHSEQSSASIDWLESEIVSPGLTNSLLAYEIEFRTCSIRDALAAPAIHQNAPTKRCIWLPLYEESQKIVEKYVTEVTYLHHVVHVPSVRFMVDDMYRDLRQSKPVKIGHASLLLGILASTTFSWTDRDMKKHSVFSTVEEANRQSTQWMKIALEVLEYSRHIYSESIEDVQAMLILMFLVFNLAGIASQTRHLISMATSVAKQLSLHRIDHPHNSDRDDIPSPSSARAEVGRRVWWYLVASDWQASQIPGPQKGTYMINPRHMMTNKPVNANDEDLVDGMAGVGQPITQPTSMSYCLQRIRLGELCREIADSVPFAMSESGAPDYERTKEIDGKVCEFAAGLPPFFLLTHCSSELSKTDPSKSTGIIIQRYIINSLLHTQRCRLHLPYLSRASKNPTIYAYSRDACLEAARMVIRTERQLSIETLPFVLGRFKVSGVLHCVCLATVALLVDFCLNKKREEERERQREILDAFEILEEAKEQSPFAGKLLESFRTVLRRHDTAPSAVVGTGNQDPLVTSGSMPTTGMIDGNAENALLDPTLPSLDELWQAFDDSVDSSTVDWNGLFAELDTPFLSM